MIDIDVKARTIGVNFNQQGNAEVVLWAPLADEAAVILTQRQESISLRKREYGYWTATTEKIGKGDLYKFRLNNKDEFPDPASLSQPEGVHGPSCAIDIKTYPWKDEGWNNIPLEDYILYELHTGTFTPEGTF